MKIGIDAQLTIGTATGIGEYVRGLVTELHAHHADVVELCEPKIDPWRFDRRVFWDQVLLPQRARAANVDVLHCASGTVPLTTAMPVVVTVHDVAWLRVQAHTRPYARYYFGTFAMERYRHACAIAVDSAFSRDELLDVIPNLDASRVHVVYPGVARDFVRVQRQRGDGRTILLVGTVERRKNAELIIDTLPSLENARLVCVGPFTPYQTECETRAYQLGVGHRVDFRGYVSRDQLLDLYATAAVAVVPSRYEGFGYGAAQALCAGIPLVSSDRASLPEVIDGDAPIVSIDDVSSWTEALRRALSGDGDSDAASVRARAIERFAWEKSAVAMMRVYEGV